MFESLPSIWKTEKRDERDIAAARRVGAVAWIVVSIACIGMGVEAILHRLHR